VQVRSGSGVEYVLFYDAEFAEGCGRRGEFFGLGECMLMVRPAGPWTRHIRNRGLNLWPEVGLECDRRTNWPRQLVSHYARLRI